MSTERSHLLKQTCGFQGRFALVYMILKWTTDVERLKMLLVITYCHYDLQEKSKFNLWVMNEIQSSGVFCGRPEVFCEKIVLKNFAKVAGKYLCQSLFLKRDSNKSVFL